MKDILFDPLGVLIGESDSNSTHKQDILIFHKGWNKFFPHLGVGIADHLNDEGNWNELQSSITYEFSRDGMRVQKVSRSASDNHQPNKLVIHANY